MNSEKDPSDVINPQAWRGIVNAAKMRISHWLETEAPSPFPPSPFRTPSPGSPSANSRWSVYDESTSQHAIKLRCVFGSTRVFDITFYRYDVEPEEVQISYSSEFASRVISTLRDLAAPRPATDGSWWADENYYPIRPVWSGESILQKPFETWTVVDGNTGEVIRESLVQSLVEGGAVGHLQHLYENRDMTFAELKEILASAAEGRLEKVSEKLDGLNCVFTWNETTGELKVARSAGDIKRGGMNAAQLADKFKDRGNLTDAFNSAFKVLSDAIAALPDKSKTDVFGLNSNFWYSVEIIYTANPNVVNYDGNAVVFHGWPVFEVDETGNVSKGENEAGVETLSSNVNRMQKAITLRSWQVRGPAIVNLKKLSDGTVADAAVAKITQAQSDAGVSDSNTIGEYLTALMTEEVADLGLPEKAAKMTVARAVGNPGAPKLTDIKKLVPANQYQAVNDFVKGAPILLKRFIAPIEAAIQSFAVELLTGLRSSLVGSHDEEVARLRQAVTAAVSAIQSSGNDAAMEVLNRQMQKLGSIENITTPVEGVVFIWKGNAYKFTGSFAAANQILGIFRYGRSKSVPVEEADLREAVDDMLLSWELNEDVGSMTAKDEHASVRR